MHSSSDGLQFPPDQGSRPHRVDLDQASVQGGDPSDDGVIGGNEIASARRAADPHQWVEAEPGDIGQSPQGDGQFVEVVDVEGREHRRHSYRDVGSGQGEQTPEGRGRRTAGSLLHLRWTVDAHPDTYATVCEHGNDLVVEVCCVGLDATGDPSTSDACNSLGDVLDEGGHQGGLTTGQLNMGRLAGRTNPLGEKIQGGIGDLGRHPTAPALPAVAVGAGKVAGGGGPQHEVADSHDLLTSC